MYQYLYIYIYMYVHTVSGGYRDAFGEERGEFMRWCTVPGSYPMGGCEPAHRV